MANYIFLKDWIICLFLALLLMSSPIRLEANRDSSTTSPPKSGDLNDWIRARCGDQNVALWAYEGALYDPLEGRRIANVEGLELVRCVSSVGDSSHPNSKQQYLQDCGDLELGPLIAHENATFDQACTMLSRKLFCYQSPDDPNQLLTSLKLRPNAPLRQIPTRQSIAAYDTATTFVARDKELIAHSEWPDGQSIWGRATRNFKSGNFDFTVYARKKSAKKTAEQLFDLTQVPIDPSLSSSNSSAVVAAPRRAKLIEFGTSSTRGKDKFGARETYSYSNIGGEEDKTSSKPNLLQRIGLQKKPAPSMPATPRVKYSRYGEGPPFFGPGRVCSLELEGRRIDSLADLPPLTARLLQERVADPQAFDASATKTIEGFRSSSLKVRPAPNERPEFWLPDYLRDKGLEVWGKLRRRQN